MNFQRCDVKRCPFCTEETTHELLRGDKISIDAITRELTFRLLKRSLGNNVFCVISGEKVF